MTHPEYIDPNLARKRCTPDELEIILMRNYQMPWAMIGQTTGRSRGIVRRIWASANHKVNGGYVPLDDDAATKRAIMVTDPDIIRGLRGIPVVGLNKSGAGIVPGRPTRSGKMAE